MVSGNVEAQLRTAINGRVIGPSDPEYDVARTVFVGGHRVRA